MHKLYDMVFTTQKEKQKLYYKANNLKINVQEKTLFLPQKSSVDLLTYFNCFSIIKWKQYTTLKKLILSGEITGKAEIKIFTAGKGGKTIDIFKTEGVFVKSFKIEDLSGELLGLEIKATTDCCIKEISYNGEFESWRNLKIRAVICTYKREKYVNATIKKLSDFSKKYPWFSSLVVDNGSTLPTCNTETVKIIHNPNYGGSGGFTRGLMEELRSSSNDYILLMDDDIDLDPTVLNHMYGLLCGIREGYKESFLSGAMLRMQTPVIQHENTAYWGKIRLHSLGSGWDLSKQDVLLKNEQISDRKNHYGAWWFCCIPLARIPQIGYPLPVFIKGDDIEYGIRNNRSIIHMNGIGIWHEAFENKQSFWVDYYAYRNFFIMNQYAKGCNRWTLLAMICGRLTVHFIKRHFKETKIFNIALRDAMQGFDRLTAVPADKQLEQVRALQGDGSYIAAVFSILWKAFKCMFLYEKIKKDYLAFRQEKLMDDVFWREYLKNGKYTL